MFKKINPSEWSKLFKKEKERTEVIYSQAKKNYTKLNEIYSSLSESEKLLVEVAN